MPGLTTAVIRWVPRIFRSVRFNILLGCAIVTIPAIGSFIPQEAIAAARRLLEKARYPLRRGRGDFDKGFEDLMKKLRARLDTPDGENQSWNQLF